jgi:sulfur relay (sulfurtransferase) DsrC/TusE family protein
MSILAETPVSKKGNIEINREMTPKRRDRTYAECMELAMTPAQKEVFLVVDEWWKQYGFGPSIRDICEIRKKGGMGNTAEIINRLVKLGVLKKVKGSGRSVRPVYIQFRNLE